MVARFWWCVCFGRPVEGDDAVDAAIAALAASGADVINSLKALKMRDMRIRDAATAVLERELAARPNSRAAEAYAPAIATGVLTPAEAALALQGVIFHTGTVQLSDALTHLALALAQHSEPGDGNGDAGISMWDRVAVEAGDRGAAPPSPDDDAGEPGQRFVERAMHEALRVWPLFGVAHRIADRDIPVPSGAGGVIAAGTVLCFEYPKLHAAGVTDSPELFLPSRWTRMRGSALPAYIPFGVVKNRPCPAQRLCLAAVPAFIQALARGLRMWSAATHTRALPGRGLAVVQLRSGAPGASLSLATQPLRTLMSLTAVVDIVDGLRLSLTQLICGTLIVLHARRAALAHRYHTDGVTPRGGSIPAAQR